LLKRKYEHIGSTELPPSPKRRIKTILGQLRNNHARQKKFRIREKVGDGNFLRK
jgi:hypothetical protein